MTVKEFFANLNRIFTNYNVDMRDISSSTEHRNSINTLMENEDLYNDWKNATILSWYVIDNEFVLIVQKEEEDSMKLDELIKGLTEIQEQYGNLTVEIMREGVHLPVIEPYIDGNFLYLEAYEEGEGLV